ncbi:MAG: ActS/PrrB/RegB family redox-sensitive histidine kinase [Alphaproteobacteria bacterium]|nr:ActS/PrrB/RegB family redox-sensitive histidine kinase [Alphaproteobacteria bacterium]
MPYSIDPDNIANGRMRRKTLIKMRWLAICGQSAALAAAGFLFNLPIDFLPPALVILTSIIFNCVAIARMRGKTYLHNKGATFALGFDTLQLASLLFVTGGFSNPFIVLMLAPITIAATVLSGRSVFVLLSITAFFYCAMFFAPPLPWPQPQQFSPLFLEGCAAAVFISGSFLVFYVRRVAREARRLSEALSASRLALEYEQKISAFGALAAAVAHELGSPLSTIAIISSELAHSLKTTPMKEDIELLQSQIERCRIILSDFSKHNVLSDQSFHSLPLRDYMLHVLEPYRRPHLAIEIITNGTGTEPTWPLSPGLMHGVGNILHNACQFAKSVVRIAIDWQDDAVKLCIEDDGPGFSAELLPRLGTPYIKESASGMGLGLFIAKTLLERSGATVAFANRSTGGAQIILSWPFAPT